MKRPLLMLVPVTMLAACSEPPAIPAAATPVVRAVVTLNGSAPLRVPRSVLVERGGIPGVFVLDTAVEPPQARFRMVRAGHPDDGRIEILSGLKGDETLVAGDLTPIRDGSAIMVKPSRPD